MKEETVLLLYNQLKKTIKTKEKHINEDNAINFFKIALNSSEIKKDELKELFLKYWESPSYDEAKVRNEFELIDVINQLEIEKKIKAKEKSNLTILNFYLNLKNKRGLDLCKGDNYKIALNYLKDEKNNQFLLNEIKKTIRNKTKRKILLNKYINNMERKDNEKGNDMLVLNRFKILGAYKYILDNTKEKEIKRFFKTILTYILSDKELSRVFISLNNGNKDMNIRNKTYKKELKNKEFIIENYDACFWLYKQLINIK